MTRPAHRHHQGHGPQGGLHTGRRRNPRAGMLIIHRPGRPDEVLSASAFRNRAHETDEEEAAPAGSARKE